MVVMVVVVVVMVVMTAAGSVFVVEKSEAMTEKDHDSLQFLHAPSRVLALGSLCEDCLSRFSALQQYDAPIELDQYQAHSRDLNNEIEHAN